MCEAPVLPPIPPEGTYSAEMQLVKNKAGQILPLDDCNCVNSDDMLTRFLIAHEGNVDKVVHLLHEYANWRKKKRINELFTGPAFPAEFSAKYICGFHGRDKEGRPLYWEKPDPKGLAELLKTHPRDDLLRWHFYLIERQRQRYKLQNSNRIAIICDISKLGFGIITNTTALGFLKEVAQLDQNLFPENMRYMIIVNAPSVFTTLWNFLKGYLDDRVKAKVHILKKDYLPYMQNYINLDQIPQEFGGKGGNLELVSHDPTLYKEPENLRPPQQPQEKTLAAAPEMMGEVTGSSTTQPFISPTSSTTHSGQRPLATHALVHRTTTSTSSTPATLSPSNRNCDSTVGTGRYTSSAASAPPAPTIVVAASTVTARGEDFIERPPVPKINNGLESPSIGDFEDMANTMSFHSVHSRESSFHSQYGFMEEGEMVLKDDTSNSTASVEGEEYQRTTSQQYHHTDPHDTNITLTNGMQQPIATHPLVRQPTDDIKLCKPHHIIPPALQPIFTGGGLEGKGYPSTMPSTYPTGSTNEPQCIFLQEAAGQLGYTVVQCVFNSMVIAETHHNMIVTKKNPVLYASSPDSLPATPLRQRTLSNTSNGLMHTPATPTTGHLSEISSIPNTPRDEYILAGSYQGEKHSHSVHECVQLYDGERNLQFILRKRRIHSEIQIFVPSFSSVTRPGPLIKGVAVHEGGSTPTVTTTPHGSHKGRSSVNSWSGLFGGSQHHQAGGGGAGGPAVRQDPAYHPPNRKHLYSCVRPDHNHRAKSDWVVKVKKSGCLAETDMEKHGTKVTWGGGLSKFEPEFVFLFAVALNNLWGGGKSQWPISH